jgi:uncharacterized protein
LIAANIPVKSDSFYVNDQAGVLYADTEQIILKNSTALQQKTGAQIVVLTVKNLGNKALEEYSLDTLRAWGIGDEQKDNGVLILLAVNDRKSRIEVGYGLEGRLPDGKTGRIQDEYMLPYFRENDYDSGIKNGYLAILNEVAAEYNINAAEFGNIKPEGADTPIISIPEGISRAVLIVIAVLVLLFDWIFLHGTLTRILLLLMLRRGRGGFGGGGFGGGRGGGGSGGGGGSSRGW